MSDQAHDQSPKVLRECFSHVHTHAHEMKSRLLIIILAIFAAVSCQKKEADPDFSSPVGHMYRCQTMDISSAYLKFIDASTVEVCRCRFRKESIDRYTRIETWSYSISGNVITFVPASKLSLGIQAVDTVFSAGEHYVNSTATFNGKEIVWEGKKIHFQGGETPEVHTFKAIW